MFLSLEKGHAGVTCVQIALPALFVSLSARALCLSAARCLCRQTCAASLPSLLQFCCQQPHSVSLGCAHPLHLHGLLGLSRVSGTVSDTVLQEGELMFREGTELVCAHVASKWQSQRPRSDGWTLCFFTDALTGAGSQLPGHRGCGDITCPAVRGHCA